jgi:hypothetical protein
MKNTIIITGMLILLGVSLLFAGCTSSSDSNDQAPGGDNVQAPAEQDQQPQDAAAQGNGQRSGRGMGGPRGGMGVQLIEACSGKGAGDVCTLTFRNQSVDGICADRSGNITCAPNNASLMQGLGSNQGGQMRGGFIQACNSKSVGDLCQITVGNQTVDGTCASRNGNITCTPKNSGPGQRNPDNPPADGQPNGP